MSEHAKKKIQIESAVREANDLRAAGRFSKALSVLEQALNRNPNNVQLLTLIGDTYTDLRRPETALNFYWTGHVLNPVVISLLSKLIDTLVTLEREGQAWTILRRALLQDPGQSEFNFSFGNVLFQMMRYPHSMVYFRRTLMIAPHHTPAKINLAEVLSLLGGEKQAINLLTAVCAAEKGNTQARLNLAMSHMSVGQYQHGLELYESRLNPIEPSAPERKLDIPRWTGESLDGKRLLVCAEQGVGDELRYSAYFPKLANMAREIYVECDQRLIPLFERSFAKAKFFHSTRTVVGKRPVHTYRWLNNIEKPDYYVDIGSIPFILGDTHKSTLPKQTNLIADEQVVEDFRRRLASIADGPWVGLHWRSGVMTPKRRRFFAPVVHWAGLVEGEFKYNFFNLNYVPTDEEAEQIKAKTDITVHQFDDLDQKNELDRTAALFSCMDLIVAAPTSVAMLGGGLGVHVLEMDSENLANPHVGGQDALLPFIEKIEPKVSGDWPDVFGQAKHRMTELLGGKGNPPK